MISQKTKSSDENRPSSLSHVCEIKKDDNTSILDPFTTCDGQRQAWLHSQPWFFKSKFVQGSKMKATSLNIYSRNCLNKSALLLHILLVLLTTTKADENCTQRVIFHKIEYKACIPERFLATACIGSCRSYSISDPDDLTTTRKSCNCCQAVDFRNARVHLRCPRPNNEIGYIRAAIYVRLPTACMCRPCSSVPQLSQAT